MAYREVTMIEVKEVLRQWLACLSREAMARWVGLDRNTIRRYLQVAQQCGLHVADGVDALTDEKLSDVLAALGTGPGRPHGEEWAICERHRETIDRFTNNSYDLVVEGESFRPRMKPKRAAETEPEPASAHSRSRRRGGQNRR